MIQKLLLILFQKLLIQCIQVKIKISTFLFEIQIQNLNSLGQASFNIFTYIQKFEISQTEKMAHYTKTRAAKTGGSSPGDGRRELTPESCPLTFICYAVASTSLPPAPPKMNVKNKEQI